MEKKMTIFGAERDILFMQHALKEAVKAQLRDEVPIGAVVVDANGHIIGRGFNKVEKLHSQTAHAEMLALLQAGKKFGDWRLEGCWLYVTLEPCSMCMHMALLSRIAGVVFGAESPLFGFHLDNNIPLQLYKKSAPIVIEGVCKDEAAQLLKQFFQTKRKRG